jgi:hypothetical protein
VEYTFSGTGDMLTQVFDLRAGLVVLVVRHQGASNFVVQIHAEDGERTELAVNTIGGYSGIRLHPVSAGSFIGLRPGQHRLQITADGDWETVVSQPVFTEGKAPPQQFSGIGDGTVDIITLSAGVVPVYAKHSGSSNFVVQVFGVDGKKQDLLVNTIGTYEGTTALRIQRGALIGLEPGLHAIAIQADGPWAIRVGE